MKVGDEREFMDKTLVFESLKKIQKSNYQSLVGEFKVSDHRNNLIFKQLKN